MPNNNLIKPIVWNLDGESIVELFELDTRVVQIPPIRFHGHSGSDSIWWKGEEYEPWAIRANNFKRTGQGTQPRPTIEISNVGYDKNKNAYSIGVISRLCAVANDFVGVKFIRRVTLARFLDEKNFPNGNPTADPDEQLPDEVWVIERKSEETSRSITFEMSSLLEFGTMKIPNRTMDTKFFQPQGSVK